MSLWYLSGRKTNSGFAIFNWVSWEGCFAGRSSQRRNVCRQLWPHWCHWLNGRMAISADLPEQVLALLPLQRSRGISGKWSLSLYTLRNCLLRNTRKETELQLESGWWKSNRWQAWCCGYGVLNSFLVATPVQAVASPAAGSCPVFHVSLLILQSHAGTAFFPGRQWGRLESKHSCLFSSRGYFSAGSSFPSLPDHMDTSAAAGTQWFMARSKPLEWTAGWGSDWPDQICHQMPDHSFGPGSIIEKLCLLI